MTAANIASTLTERAAAHPFQPAVAFPAARDAFGRACYSQLNYAQLEAAANQVARGLLAHGIGHGMRTAFMVKPSLEFFILTFALFKAKAIPILIDPGIGMRAIKGCLAEAQAEAFIGIPAAHLARLLFRWRGAARWKKLVSIGGSGPFSRLGATINWQDLLQAGSEDRPLPTTEAHELAAVLFTSGSTGAPKGVVYTHANFQAQIRLLRATLGIEAGERDLCTFPLFALFAPALGMSSVIPDMDFTRPGSVDPLKIKEAIDTFGITNMFGSPALIRRLADYGCARQWQFPSLRRVISAGAPVPAALIEQFRAMLREDCAFFTPYGATEALPVAIAESRMILTETQFATAAGRGICIGRPVPGTEAKIIRITDQAISQLNPLEDLLPDGSIGELIVAAAQVTTRYENRDEATRLSKIASDLAAPAGSSFFHRMGDLAYRDGEGRLWFCGRKSQRVISAKGELYTINCEAIFNQHPLVARTALVGLGQVPLQLPAICVELRDQKLKASELRQLYDDLRALALRYPHTQAIEHFYFHRHKPFPVDIRHNAKIFREKLKTWAEKQWRKESSSRVAAAFWARPSLNNSSNVALPSRL